LSSKQYLRLDSVLTVVDCKHLPMQLEKMVDPDSKNVDPTRVGGAHGTIPEAVQQNAFAGRIIMNKMDLVSKEDAKVLLEKIRSINPHAIVMRSVRATGRLPGSNNTVTANLS